MALPVSQGGIDYQDGGFSSGGNIYPLALDVGELAARLGSIDTHNREGNIVLLETFEHGLGGWTQTAYGTGAEIRISTEKYRSSGYSCRLNAGSDGAQQSTIFRKFPYPAIGRYGLEFSFLIELHTNKVLWALVHHDGTSEYQFRASYNVLTRKLYIRVEDGSWVTVDDDLYLGFQYAGFHTVKLVVDLETEKYIRLIVNNEEYDISQYSAYPYEADDGAHIRPIIYVESEPGYQGYSYIDDVIVTQNEPPAR